MDFTHGFTTFKINFRVRVNFWKWVEGSMFDVTGKHISFKYIPNHYYAIQIFPCLLDVVYVQDSNGWNGYKFSCTVQLHAWFYLDLWKTLHSYSRGPNLRLIGSRHVDVFWNVDVSMHVLLYVVHLYHHRNLDKLVYLSTSNSCVDRLFIYMLGNYIPARMFVKPHKYSDIAISRSLREACDLI